jgi:demethylmenaquinone methyltransferase/2-methoxy-6-polyprenyl-1,4-benzoquinol methylase
MPDTTHAPDSPSRQDAYKMFDRIAHRYDLLNRMLSMGTDRGWRKRMAAFIPDKPQVRLLDLATGTADVMLFLEGRCPRVTSAVGLDMSGGMLGYGHEKIRRRGLSHKLRLMRGDGTKIGAADDSFDAVTISFGIRNFLDVPAGLREMRRVLRSRGRVLILEFSIPANPFVRIPYLLYFRHVLPVVGGIVSGDSSAYRYLNKTVETFPYGEAFAALMRDAGFTNVKAIPLSFGIATLYVGDKA